MKVPSIADAVQRALLFFDGKRYGLCAWCVMPNHVHAMVQTFDRFSLETVVHSWKSFSAHKANRILQRTGRFWQPEYHDRYVRDARHFRAAVAYIENNPVKAGLTASPDTWPWSSALCPPGSAGVTPACPIAFDE
jgi:REP element-mobilizing transposase RayT